MIQFDINSKNSQKFEQMDPFNTENIVSGYLCRVADKKYGMLFITEINGISEPQIIWSIPKMDYPFRRETKTGERTDWCFPESYTIDAYEKLDGSGVVQFTYHHDGKKYISYKTRLSPFLHKSRFGDFFNMWNEMLEKYPGIKDLPNKNPGFNIAFELYGKRNKVIVEYDNVLDCAVLFGISNEGVVVTPDTLDLGDIPIVTKLTTITEKSNLQEEYEKLERWLDEHIRVDTSIIKEKEEKIIKGIEGSVWYLVGNTGAVQKKVKPKIIRDIHYAASGGIPIHSIYSTIINAYEDADEVTFEQVKEMLLEEFQESEIYKKEICINKLMEEIKSEKILKSQVLEDYRKLGMDINVDRGAVMRWFAGKYEKRMCGKIFKILWDNYGKEIEKENEK